MGDLIYVDDSKAEDMRVVVNAKFTDQYPNQRQIGHVIAQTIELNIRQNYALLGGTLKVYANQPD